jgi:hypothetical protein
MREVQMGLTLSVNAARRLVPSRARVVSVATNAGAGVPTD